MGRNQKRVIGDVSEYRAIIKFLEEGYSKEEALEKAMEKFEESG